MNSWKSAICGGLVTLCLALASGCGTSTRLAVKNSGDAAIDVEVSSGSDEASFSDVAAGTTTAFKDIEWEDFGDVTVSVGGEDQTVDLEEGEDNVVQVAGDGTVTVTSVASSDGDNGGGGW